MKIMGRPLAAACRGAETTGLGEHQVRCIHIGGDILGEAQDPEIGPVAQLQKALVKLFVVAADDDEHAILRQHFRQAAGQTLDGAAAHASAHEKGHPLVRRDAEGGPAFRTAAGCEEDLTHGDAGGDEPLFGNAAPGEFVCQLFVRDKVAVCLGLGHIGAAGVVRGYQIVGDGDGIILTDPAHHQTGKDMGADHGVIASSLQGGVHTALSLTDLFVQQIENMILSGELAFGEQLPPARELAAKMGVSRTVVTAGLVELEKLGFVEIKARQGVYVCDYRRRGTMETLVAIMRYNGGALRQNEVRSLLETRDAMECMCMRLVVERSDTASLEALAPVLESIRTARDSDEAAENVFLFHHELAVLSGNVLMPLLYHSFRPQSVYLWTIDCKRSGIQKMYESKLALYTALLNGDAPTAVRLTHERIVRAIEALPLFGA